MITEDNCSVLMRKTAASVESIIRARGYPDAIGTMYAEKTPLGLKCGVGIKVGDRRHAVLIRADEGWLSSETIASEIADKLLECLGRARDAA